jgi:hypothetical protein
MMAGGKVGQSRLTEVNDSGTFGRYGVGTVRV